MTKETNIIYIAYDGTKFLSEEKCKEYEKAHLLDDFEGSYFYDINGNPIKREQMITRTIFIADLRSKKTVEIFKKIQNRNGLIDVTNINENKPDVYFYEDTFSEDTNAPSGRWYNIDSFLEELEQAHPVYAMAKKMKKEKKENNNE